MTGKLSWYGAVVGLTEKLTTLLAGSKANPQEIADSVLQIIETPAGQRRLRYRVAANDLGVTRINAVTDAAQAQLLEAFGIAEVTGFRKH